MLRFGYEITVTCAQPTPLVCLMSASGNRKADIRVAERTFTTSIIAIDNAKDAAKYANDDQFGFNPDSTCFVVDRGGFRAALFALLWRSGSRGASAS